MKSGNERTEAESTAEAVGVIIGAAYACDSISQERLQSTVDKARDAVMAIASDQGEAEAAVDYFSAGFDTGQRAIESGRMDRQRAESAFLELEEELTKCIEPGEARPGGERP